MVQPPGRASPRPISGVSIEDREMDGQTDAQPEGWVNLQEGFISDDKSHYMHGGEGGQGGGDLSASCVQPNSLSAYSEWLPSCLHSGNAMGLLWLGLPESALTSGIQPPADSLDPSFWPAAFSRTEKRKQHTPSWSLEPAHKSL